MGIEKKTIVIKFRKQKRCDRSTKATVTNVTNSEFIRVIRTMLAGLLESHTVTARLSLILNIIICFQA